MYVMSAICIFLSFFLISFLTANTERTNLIFVFKAAGLEVE